jgi:hypothetical protein
VIFQLDELKVRAQLVELAVWQRTQDLIVYGISIGVGATAGLQHAGRAFRMDFV